MAELAPNLDDLRFQKDLVDEARRRIVQYCPEWTDYNLSDPGITLIELFSWMTEMLVYRLNRVPERNYFKFLEMMGVSPQPASSARAQLTFYLSVPFPISANEEITTTIPQGLEVTTNPTEAEQEITFTVDERFTIEAPRMVQLRRGADVNKNYLPSLGVEQFHAFHPVRPQVGDTFYLGFDEAQDLRGYILRLTFECEESQAVGVRRDDPPWVWECSLGENAWQEIPLSMRKGEKDTTGGLNNPQGSLVLNLPLIIRPDKVHGRSAYWLRCRLEPRRPEQGMYSESPRVRRIEAHVLGGATWATQASQASDELLGHSTGEPGQVFRLMHAPVLAIQDQSMVEVEEKRGSDLVFVPWARVKDFSDSDRYDRHFTIDEASGEVHFGPAVRQPDGSVRQYGRVPEAGRKIRAKQYSYGGGSTGNVPAEKINVMRSAVPYIDRVTNYARAEGGRDQENLEELKMRVRREMRAQERAVTAEDFENLAKAATREVARVKAMSAGPNSGGLAPGTIELLIVPAVFDSLRTGDLSRLRLEPALHRQIQNHLDKYRLLTTVINIREPAYIGTQVCAQIVVTPFSQPDLIAGRVNERLNQFLSPLPIGGPESPDEIFGSKWEGWPFGRDLFIAELYSVIQQVPGVKHVLDISLSCRPVVLGEQKAEGNEAGSSGLTLVTQKMLSVPADTLLCSLDHQVEVVDL